MLALLLLACASPYEGDRSTRHAFANDLAMVICLDRQPCEGLGECLDRFEPHFAGSCPGFDAALARRCIDEALAEDADRCAWPPKPLPMVCAEACGIR